MGDDFRENLVKAENWLKGLPKEEKKNMILMIGVSIFIMGVFFYTPPQKVTLAKNANTKKPVSLNELIPEKKLGTFVYKSPKERKKPDAKPSVSFPKDKKNSASEEERIVELVAGRPIEKMVPHISKRDKRVASFLVAIAKKESDWGKYSPKKSGRDCYNYWGYRGGYNLTASGYSCFDSPEHAVQVVGDRIENLVGKKIDTPAKMVVWKCGRDCEAAGGQAAANKWISDVALYYGKLNS